jgi:hypothetical protein
MAFAQHEVEGGAAVAEARHFEPNVGCGRRRGPAKVRAAGDRGIAAPAAAGDGRPAAAAARQVVEAIAGEWRARFRELLEKPLSEAEAA